MNVKGTVLAMSEDAGLPDDNQYRAGGHQHQSDGTADAEILRFGDLLPADFEVEQNQPNDQQDYAHGL